MSHVEGVRTNELETEHTDLATLRAVTRAAAAVFIEAPRRHAAVTYLRQRGIDARDLLPAWSIGYAPRGWTRLVDRFAGEFGEQALLDAGVARRCNRGTLIDTFRDRVIFGIHDESGEIAGFIGRDVSGGQDVPKYLNTRQHALFDKGALLFGLAEGRGDGPLQPVVVEGPLDVLAIASRGSSDNTGLLPVAACGTAFTPAQAKRLAVVAFAHQSSVVVAMDGDAPGRSAALAVGERLHAVGLDSRIAILPNGSDPAEHLSRADATLDTVRAVNALPLLAVRVEHAIAAQDDRMRWVEGRLAALRSVAGHLATYPPNYAARQAAWLADTLDLAPSTVTFELADAHRGQRHSSGELELPHSHSIHDEGRDLR